jgi:hypothetical protein
MDIIAKKNQLFDENFNSITTDVEEIISFCDILRNKTGVQVCNCFGMMYEYLPQVYNSVVKLNEM